MATTDAEWLAARTVLDLNLFLSAPGRHRKWRLFGCACCRRALAHFNDLRLAHLLDGGERFAEGAIHWDELKRRRVALTLIEGELHAKSDRGGALGEVVKAVRGATNRKPLGSLGAPRQAMYAFGAAIRAGLVDPDSATETGTYEQAILAEAREQVRLAREVFGNPFRPSAFDPAWRTRDVLGIAGVVQSERRFHDLPVLADALEDAGCDSPELLAHLRHGGDHTLGCWALDLALGKA